MPDPITVSSIAAAWKLLGSLVEKYQGWSVRRKTSKDAAAKKARAEVLMRDINQSILSGASSDDPDVAKLVREFRTLLAEDVKPEGHEATEHWVIKSQAGSYIGSTGKKPAPAKRPAAKKAAPRKAAAKKMAAKKPAAKKASAKRA